MVPKKEYKGLHAKVNACYCVYNHKLVSNQIYKHIVCFSFEGQFRHMNIYRILIIFLNTGNLNIQVQKFTMIFNQNNKGLFDEKTGMEWNQDLNPEGLGMELES